MVRKLGDVLGGEGYLGYFEVDLLHDLDSDELYLGEVNLRLSGASPMTNLTTEAYADIPLFLFHLLEFMDVDYELDVDEINALAAGLRGGRGLGPGDHRRDLDRGRTLHQDAANRCLPARRRRTRIVRPPCRRLGFDHR